MPLRRFRSIRSSPQRRNASDTRPIQQAPRWPHAGVIAQSMPPETVSKDGAGMLGLNLADAVGDTIGALRGLDVKTGDATAALERRIAEREQIGRASCRERVEMAGGGR